MANKMKHRERARYSSHNKPDFRPFTMNASGKAFAKATRANGAGFMASLLAKAKSVIDKATGAGREVKAAARKG